MDLETVCLLDYTLNEKNSRKEEKPTRLDPGSPRSLVIDIQKISVEMKVSELKKLKVGMTLDFKIYQELEFSVPNLKSKEYEDITEYVNGKGSGELSEVLDNPSFEDYDENEYEEVTLIISNGYAEGL